MKAYVIKDIGKMEYEEVKVPQIGVSDVLVEVAATGICGSDIPRIYSGGAYFYPLISGHEFAGKIVEVGSKADPGLKGKRVSVFPLIPCNECDQCRQKKYELCQKYGYLGSRQNGGFAEYVLVPAWNVMELPEDIDYEVGALIEPMCVAVHAIRHIEITKEDRILVFGAGSIGLFVTMFLLEAGYENVYVIGKKDIQRRKAIELGLNEENYCDSSTEDVDIWIKDHTDDHGADILFECVGDNKTINESIRNTAYAAKVVLVGNPRAEVCFDKKTYSTILRRQLTIKGTWNSSFTRDEDDDWHYVVERLANKRIRPEILITHRYDFDKLAEGFDMIHRKSEEYVKVMGIVGGR